MEDTAIKLQNCSSNVRVITAGEVEALLAGAEEQLIEQVSVAYAALNDGHALVPQSTFLQFGDNTPDRIIALPAFLAGEDPLAGIKWISSVPSNRERCIDRASAIIALNDRATGRVTELIEGSLISAKRTAASAALAARVLAIDPEPETLGMIGLGLINTEILNFLTVVFPTIRRVVAFDIAPTQLKVFSKKCTERGIRIDVVGARDIPEVLRSAALVSIATTASTPHIFSLEGLSDAATVLHVSLRDLSPQMILASNNVVDDIDHVCRAATSLHLAEPVAGNRDFMVSLVHAMRNPRQSWARARPTIFSPFGLGVLDLVVARFVRERANLQNVGTLIGGFHPEAWGVRSVYPAQAQM